MLDDPPEPEVPEKLGTSTEWLCESEFDEPLKFGTFAVWVCASVPVSADEVPPEVNCAMFNSTNVVIEEGAVVVEVHPSMSPDSPPDGRRLKKVEPALGMA